MRPGGGGGISDSGLDLASLPFVQVLEKIMEFLDWGETKRRDFYVPLRKKVYAITRICQHVVICCNVCGYLCLRSVNPHVCMTKCVWNLVILT